MPHPVEVADLDPDIAKWSSEAVHRYLSAWGKARGVAKSSKSANLRGIELKVALPDFLLLQFEGGTLELGQDLYAELHPLQGADLEPNITKWSPFAVRRYLISWGKAKGLRLRNSTDLHGFELMSRGPFELILEFEGGTLEDGQRLYKLLHSSAEANFPNAKAHTADHWKSDFRQLAATPEAFRVPYMDPNGVIPEFMEHLEWCRNQWEHDGESDGRQIHSPYIPIVQSSMTGKSRMFFELPKHGVFIFYICLRNSQASGFPLSIPFLVSALTDDSCTEGFYCAFFLAALDKLRDFRRANPGANSTDWFETQNRNEMRLWSEILEKARADALHPPFSGNGNDLNTELSGAVRDRLTQLSLRDANVLFIMDEARTLLKEKYDPTKPKNLDHVRSAWLQLGQKVLGLRCPFGIVTDTVPMISHICPISPIRCDESSARAAKMPNGILPPFYLFANVDIWLHYGAPQCISQMHDFKFYSRYGRPHWGALAVQKLIDINDCMNVARMKLLGGHSTSRHFSLWSVEDCHAILGVRVCVDVNAQHPLSHSLLAQHLRTLFHISPDRSSLTTAYISEPMLVQAAAQLTNCWPSTYVTWSTLLDALIPSVKNGEVEGGYRGELVSRILLIMAWDACCISEKSKSEEWFSSGVFLRAVPLTSFLDSLLNLGDRIRQQLIDWLGKHGETCWVRCTHFMKVDFMPNSAQLLDMFRRGVVAITKQCQVGIDWLIPVACCHDVHAILTPEHMTHVAGKSKNQQSPDRYYPWSASTCLAPKYTGVQTQPKLPALSLFMSFGDKKGAGANVERLFPKGTGKQDMFCLAAFTLTPTTYKVLNDPLAERLRQVGRSWLDPWTLHEDNPRRYAMVCSMLPFKYYNLKDEAKSRTTVAPKCGSEATNGGKARQMTPRKRIPAQKLPGFGSRRRIKVADSNDGAVE